MEERQDINHQQKEMEAKDRLEAKEGLIPRETLAPADPKIGESTEEKQDTNHQKEEMKAEDCPKAKIEKPKRKPARQRSTAEASAQK